ncbi:MAG: dihydropteroate synthase [Candidatus Omnitrophica bacterium]|nr:dihydropteroate synthase [Candidatus Omnitrophota bacterium]MDD5610401.1 dihydropteroate synthase [Candidatus Omnitrophota bacterium]
MFIIGELLNGMYKEVGEAIKKKDKSVIQRIAKEQVARGAGALDLNCGPVSKDPVQDMQWLIQAVQEAVDIPLSLDSTKANVIAEGLKLVKNKAIINSTSADAEKLEILVPLAIQYNASLIGLTLDKKGVPQDKDRRLELAARIVADCQEKGFPVENLYIDPIVLPVNVAQNQARDVLEVLREFKIISDPPPKTVVGLSNVSQGTCNRSIINRTFLAMAIGAGLDAAILDPLDKELMNVLITSELILNKQIYCDSYLDAYRKK